MPKPRLNPPPYHVENFNDYGWKEWFEVIFNRVGEGPFSITGIAVADLPDADDFGSLTSGESFTSLIFVPDESGGPTLAFSNGTNWLRVQDLAIVT